MFCFDILSLLFQNSSTYTSANTIPYNFFWCAHPAWASHSLSEFPWVAICMPGGIVPQWRHLSSSLPAYWGHLIWVWLPITLHWTVLRKRYLWLILSALFVKRVSYVPMKQEKGRSNRKHVALLSLSIVVDNSEVDSFRYSG